MGDQALISEALGDYRDAIAKEQLLKNKPVYSGSDLSAEAMLGTDLPLDHDFSAPAAAKELQLASLTAMSTGQFSTDYPPLPEFERAAALGDWRRARDSLTALLRMPIVSLPSMRWIVPVWVRPKLALADAMLGDMRGADALIANTPRDCYLCLRMRGAIRAAEGRWGAAAYWFAVRCRPDRRCRSPMPIGAPC